MTAEDLVSEDSLPVEPVQELFAVRESSMASRDLLEGMVYQTLGPHAGKPSVSEVMAVAIEPLSGRSQFPHHLTTGSRFKSVLFTHGDSAFLYALGSAAKADPQLGENRFVLTLCDAITALRPQSVIVHEFARMLRSAEWAGKLMKTLIDTGTVVHTGGLSIDVRTSEGRLQYQLYALIADQERMSMLRRFFGGLVNKHKRGEWMYGEQTVPPGYRIDSSGRIGLDPAQVKPVKKLIELLADTSLGTRDVMDLAGRAGCTSLTLQRLYGPEATFADARRADSKLRSLLDHIPMWQGGTYRLVLPNPFPGAERFGAYKVINPDPPLHYGHVEFNYELELPPGGWGTDEAFTAARKRGLSRKQRLALGPVPPTGGAAHRKRRPLSGWAGWSDDNHLYRLSGGHASYLLMRQPKVEGLAWTDDRGKNSDRLASIDTVELHETMVNSITDALGQGAGLELVDGLRFWQLSELRSNLRNDSDRKRDRVDADIKRTRSSYDRARRNASTVTDPELAEDFLADATTFRSKLRELENERDESAIGEDTTTPDSFTSDAAFLAHGIAALARCGDRAPRELADALAQIIQFDGVKLDALDRKVTLTFHLLIPADGRVGRFGPLSVTVTNRAYLATLSSLDALGEARDALCLRLSHGSPHIAARKLALALTDRGWSQLASSTLSRSGIKSLYQIAFHVVNGDDLPDELDPAFVEHVMTLYADPSFIWNRRYHRLDSAGRQTMVDAVVAAGGELGHQQLFDKIAPEGLTLGEINLASRPQKYGKGSPWYPSLERVGVWERHTPRAGRSLRAIRCPHCGNWASRVARMPEVTATLICPDCCRMPTANSPRFPTDFAKRG